MMDRMWLEMKTKALLKKVQLLSKNKFICQLYKIDQFSNVSIFIKYIFYIFRCAIWRFWIATDWWWIRDGDPLDKSRDIKARIVCWWRRVIL